MSEAGNRHHRDRWHPRPLFIYRIVKREKRCSILPATIRVAVDLEAAAIRGQPRKVGVAGAAGLSSLPGVTRQGARRHRKLDYKNCSKDYGREADQRQEKPGESTS